MDLFILDKSQSDGKRPEIARLPQSSVVNRLKSFLPDMAAANAKLDQQVQLSPEAFNIENVCESDPRVIEMNIAVFERDDDSSASSDEDSSDDEISDISDNDTRSAELEGQKVANSKQIIHERQLPRIKMPKTSSKRRSQPGIEVLRSSETESSVQETCNNKQAKLI